MARFNRLWNVLLTATLGLVIYGCGGQRPLPTPSALTGVRTVFDENDPNLSANGRYLVFSSNRDSSHNVYLYDLQNRRLINLPGLNSEQFTATQPAVSNNGRFIVFVSNRLGKSEIFLYDRETRGFENISRGNPGDVRHPSISGDGSTIAYEQNSLGQWDIEVYVRRDDAPRDVVETPEPTQ
ncbi:MAG: TolB family protein [Synechococcus sp.]